MSNEDKRLKKIRKDLFTQQHALRLAKDPKLRKSIQDRIDQLNAEKARIILNKHPD